MSVKRPLAIARAEGVAPGSLPPPPYKVFYEDGQHVIGVYKNVSIIVWATPATADMVKRIEGIRDHIVSAYPQGRSSINVIVRDTPPPFEDGRAQLLMLTKRYAHELACNVAVVEAEGEGFWSSGMRGLITNFHWLEERQFKSRTCKTFEEVAGWLPTPHKAMTSVALDPTELLSVLRSVRARIVERR